MRKHVLFLWLLTLGVAFTSVAPAQAQDEGRRRFLPRLFPHRRSYIVPMENVVPSGPLTVDEAKQIAFDAYIYGYSLITTEVTRVQMTNVPKAEGLRSPMGQFINVRRYPPGDYRGVSAPNADTLYSLAWLDVGPEPMRLLASRYGEALLPVPDVQPVDAGGRHRRARRTAGGEGGQLPDHRPGLEGTVPAGMKQIKSPTRYLVILGRTYADGTEEDYKIVNALQAQYKLVPLSALGKPYTYKAPPVDPNPGFSMTDKPQQVIDAMDTSTYFNMMTRLMGDAAPPAPEDAPIIARMAQDRDRSGPDLRHRQARSGGAGSVQGYRQSMASAKIFAPRKLPAPSGTAGAFPARPATTAPTILAARLIAAFGWPANLPQDAMYPYDLRRWQRPNKLNGRQQVHADLPKGQTPPVDGFWSITMYFDDGGWWFYPNPLNKFTVSMRDKPNSTPTAR